MRVNQVFNTLTSGFLGCFFFACSMLWAGAAAAQDARITWVTYSTESMPALDMDSTQLRLVLFRPTEAQPIDTPVGIFVNGRLLSSLLPGGFTDAVVCRDNWALEARSGATGTARFNGPVQGSQEVFLRVSGSPGKPGIAVVSTAEFLKHADSLRRQNHVVSRLPPLGSCRRDETRYTLASELLFQFGKHGIEDLLRSGEHEIVKLARKIREEHELIDTVSVVGHTDPMGSRELNLRLSASRAETVASVMLGAGLPADKLKSVGMAADQLVVPGCDAKALPRTELLACNQANRRVEIVVKGARRTPN